MSSVGIARQIQQEQGDQAAILFLERRLKRNGVSCKGKSIKLSTTRYPVGNKSWGMIGFLQAVGQYSIDDFAAYQKNVFGEDGFNYYPWKRQK